MPAGRPRKKILISPEKYAFTLAEKQCSNIEIASRLEISVDTLTRNYAEVVAKGRNSGKVKLRQAMYKAAIDFGNTTMQIWLSKNLLGMADKTSMELSGPESSPLQLNVVSDLISDPKLAAIASDLAIALAVRSCSIRNHDEPGTMEAGQASPASK